MNLTDEERKLSVSCYEVMKHHWRENYNNFYFDHQYHDIFDMYEQRFHKENSEGYNLRSNKIKGFIFVNYMMNFMADYFAKNDVIIKTISSILKIDDAAHLIMSNIIVMIINTLVHDTTLLSKEKLRNIGMKKLESFYNNKQMVFKSFLFYDYNYYFLRFCGVPFHLRNLDLPKEHYSYFEKFIKDPICGHPMASHGWYRESLDALIEMGAITPGI